MPEKLSRIPEKVGLTAITPAELPEKRHRYDKIVAIAPLSREDLRLSQMDDVEVELEILSNLSKMQTPQA